MTIVDRFKHLKYYEGLILIITIVLLALVVVVNNGITSHDKIQEFELDGFGNIFE